MGLLRSFAKRLVSRMGGETATAPATTPSPPRPPAQVGRGPVSVTAGEEGPVADADALANLEAGAQEIKERVEAGEPVVLLDVREPHETRHGIIAGARTIPLGQLEARWREVEKCNEIVCYCAHGMRSVTAARLLRAKGLFNATSLEGGVAAWQALGGKLA
ncbi:MAG: rhodanese-like domain-containing protein [Myxococcales bacterium]|nr:rhodanese-like domain-containing protein [Myxococcales bacterium]